MGRFTLYSCRSGAVKPRSSPSSDWEFGRYHAALQRLGAVRKVIPQAPHETSTRGNGGVSLVGNPGLRKENLGRTADGPSHGYATTLLQIAASSKKLWLSFPRK